MLRYYSGNKCWWRIEPLNPFQGVIGMLVTILLWSAKLPFETEENVIEAEQDRLGMLGYEASTNENGRMCVYVENKELNDVKALWEMDIFEIGEHPKPEMMTVFFRQIRCQSVNCCNDGQTGHVVMVNPDDPIHTPLLSFTVTQGKKLSHDTSVLRGRRIEVRFERNSGDATNSSYKRIDVFMRVLRICEQELFVPGKNVRFNTRKRIGRAKRRYLLWVRREGKDLDDRDLGYLKGIDQGLSQFRQEVGKLSDAEETWKRIVDLEQSYKSL